MGGCFRKKRENKGKINLYRKRESDMIQSDMLLILLLMKELDIQIKFYSLIKKYQQSFF